MKILYVPITKYSPQRTNIKTAKTDIKKAPTPNPPN